jgi:hypothetical protein
MTEYIEKKLAAFHFLYHHANHEIGQVLVTCGTNVKMTVVNETKQHVHVQNKIIMYFMDSTIISSLLLALGCSGIYPQKKG